MRHRVATKKLGKMPDHRKAMLRNMMISLFKHERIKTTKQKAKVLRSLAEKTITRAKVDSVHNRRLVARKIHEKSVLDKLFKVIAPRFLERNGGYTRILKLQNRINDDAQLVFIELVDRKEKDAKAKKKAAVKDSSEKNEQKKTVPTAKKATVQKAKTSAEKATSDKQKADEKKSVKKEADKKSAAKAEKKEAPKQEKASEKKAEAKEDEIEKTVIKEKAKKSPSKDEEPKSK